jgi:hypothetical protein
VAKPHAAAVKREGGQVLAFFAVAMPIVLLPVAAYAVDAAVVTYRAAGLQAATAQAAETAAQQIDIGTIRSGGGRALDAVAVKRAATKTVDRGDPAATIDSITVEGVEVTVVTSESVLPTFALLTGAVTLHARATARLVAGYARPSSLFPLPSSSF